MARRTLTFDDIYQLKEASDPRLSPDGRTVAFVVTTADKESDENHHSIWSVDADGGEPFQLTRGTADRAPRWSPDGAHLAFIRKSEDGPAQIWLLPTHGGEPRQLSTLPLGASGMVWAPDASRLAVVAPVDLDGEPNDDAERERRAAAPLVIRSAAYKSDGTGLIGSKRMHLFVLDASSGEAQELTKGDLNVSVQAWSPDGRRIAFAASREDRDITSRSHLYVVDVSGGESDEIAAWDGTAGFPVFSPDGLRVVFLGARHVGAAHNRLFTVNANGGAPEELAASFDRNVMPGGPAYPGALPVFASDGRLLFCARDRGCTNAYVLDGSGARKIAGDGERVVSGLSVSGDRMAYIVSSPDVPADIFIASTDGSDERRLTHLNAELLDDVQLHRGAERTFVAPDGVEVHGWLIEGDGEKPQPLLVDIHGGPHNAWSPAFDAVHIYHEALASQGWSILRLNPRGSDGYGEDFYTAVVGKWGEIDEQDFLSAIDTLVDEGTADPQRIAVCGYSYGGHMTNWLTARTDRFAAAVSGGCLSNYLSFTGNSDVGYWIGPHEFGAETYEAPERYAELSPITYVEGVTAPTLILHGENDDRCPVGQAEEWFVALRRRGIEVEFVRYPGASHLFILSGRPSHRIDYNQRITDWLTTHCR